MTTSASALTPTDPQDYGKRADLALRCAWLRGTAHQLFAEETEEDKGCLGQIAAQLLDHADLLEVAEREGWWMR